MYNKVQTIYVERMKFMEDALDEVRGVLKKYNQEHLLNGFEKKFQSKKKSMRIEIIVEEKLKVNEVIEILEKHQVTILNVEIEKFERDLRAVYIKMSTLELNKLLALFEEISKLEHVNHAARLVK